MDRQKSGWHASPAKSAACAGLTSFDTTATPRCIRGTTKTPTPSCTRGLATRQRRDDLPTVPVSPAVAGPVERRPAFERVDLREFVIGAKSVFWFVAAVRSAVCDSRLRTLRAVLRT
ncbi:hypothetical protein NFJ02_33g83770 [Pycnococcus provasolii]